jgi:hypothetical protein
LHGHAQALPKQKLNAEQDENEQNQIDKHSLTDARQN